MHRVVPLLLRVESSRELTDRRDDCVSSDPAACVASGRALAYPREAQGGGVDQEGAWSLGLNACYAQGSRISTRLPVLGRGDL